MVNIGKIIDRNYGSIPHLSTSKLNQKADKKISIGQEIILTKKARDYKDLIIVTEKLDGSNVGVIKKKNKLMAITRSGYTAISSQYNQHKYFDEWVLSNKNKFNFLSEGYRITGEWMIKTHGIIYDISGECPFVAFDIFDDTNKRICYMDFIKICALYKIQTVPLLHIGQPISLKNSVKLFSRGHYGICENPEGVVYKCERENKVDFLAKWVRADKEDGKYMKSEIYNRGYKI